MPKRIVILDPHGVEVASGKADPETAGTWEFATYAACVDLWVALRCPDSKLGTYTVTVKEVE